jgi:predicted RNA binding protein YcfA (HicA-like mRNA interferase family)
MNYNRYMPPLSELPSKMNRDTFVCVLRKLGFEISKRGGKGSHYKVTWPRTQKSTTIQKNLRKDVLRYVIEQIEKITDSEITWDRIKGNL